MKRIRVVLCLALALGLMAALASSAQALEPNGTQGWFWQMPQPGTLSYFGDIAFPDAGNVFAVGAGGAILHSTDGGATWAAQQAPTHADLSSVSFPDDKHGWACGGESVAGPSSAVVVATSDGGTTWVDRTPSGITDSCTTVSFVDDLHGWIGTTGGGVLRTDDGGATWTSTKISPGYKNYVDVDFVDQEHGWAGGVGGHIWATTNGGATWKSQPSGLTGNTFVMQLDFLDPSHGWALAESFGSGVARLMKTSNGGHTWRTVSTGNPYVSDLYAVSASTVWLLNGDFFYGDIFSGGSVIMQHTTDGGAHWQTSSVGAPASVTAIAAKGDDVYLVGQSILTSSDAGATWRSATSGQQYAFSGAAAISATNIWAVDESGALLHSDDGVHWVEQPGPAPWTNILLGVSFPDSQNGWVVGADGSSDSGVILHTGDGGVTWGPQASNLAGELNGVDFVDASNGWAISNDNWGFGVGAPLTIEHTTDGGVSWMPQYVINNASLRAIDFITDTTGWVSGSYQDGPAQIYVTTNGGVTWSKQKLPGGAPVMTGLQFLDAKNGWAAGVSVDNDTSIEQGWVVHTTDGGKTWGRLAGLDDCLAYTVHFSDAQNGWLGGENGVWATTDGGATWQQVAGGNGVEAIAATDPQHVWAFGYGFLLSTLDANGDTAAPVTLVDSYKAWSHDPVTVHLSANDVGGSGVKSTDYSSDGGTTWQPGTSVSVAAPADHSNDGVHAVLYRSTDNAGNTEQTGSLYVGIDTLGPACSAPRRMVADAGKQGVLYFMAGDATSDVAQATISIVDSRGHVVRRFVEHAGDWGASPAPSYFWLRFKCTLKQGTYRVEVRATDRAGNPQVLIGRNTLRVVSHGAPVFHKPWWPAGMPYSSTGFARRLGHGPKAQRLVRLFASEPGPWRAPFLSAASRPR